ncbi:MAG: ABC transporter substrate-binding protein [Bacillota bacterium]|jgi:peptide/nickel transport system substrate-binding protein|nr:ABC transporter substrate-binding protein [Bacillota bacterium]HHU30759.1 ABC transporter substrate-binding protein [Bacillota bacterium]
MKKKLWLSSFLVVVLVLALSISGCSSSAKKPNSEGGDKKAGAEGPVYGGVLKIITGGGATNLGSIADPVTGSDLLHSSPAVETLLRVDEQGLPTPWLATSWEVSTDSKSMKLTLQQGVKFHDGTEFNAEVVKWNLDTYRNSNMPGLNNVTSIDIIDPYTVQLNFSEFWSTIYSTLAWDAGRMLSPTAQQTHDKEWLYSNPVGTGPFKIVEYQQDVGVKYEKWDEYWQEGKPYLDGVEYSFIVDRTVSLMALKSGQAHVNQFIDPRDVAELEKEGKYDITKVAAAVTYAAGDSINPNSPFAKLEVRQALSHAIPKDQLPGLVGYGSEAASQLTFPESMAYNPNVKDYDYNPEKAKQLLAEAGYPNGFDTTIWVHEYIEKDAWTAIQGWLKDVGINAEIKISTWPRHAEICWTEGWKNGLVAQGTNESLHPVANLMDYMSSQGTQSPIKIDYPEEYMDALKRAQKESDPEILSGSLHEIMSMITDEYAMVTPLYVYYMVGVRSQNVHDSLLYEHTTYLWTPEDAWLSK